MVFSLPSEKKAMERLSGDQKGNLAFSVDRSGVDAPVRSEWSHSCPPAPKSAISPLGERATGAPESPVSWNDVFSGAARKEWTGCRGSIVRPR
jgi:hypothetical protein